MTAQLQNKIAIVTGSTSGIGLGIARILAGAGAHVVLNGFGDAGEIAALCNTMAHDCGTKILHHAADVTQPDQVAEMVAQTVDQLGGVDILINNAGIQYVAPIEEFPIEKWHTVIGTNLSSAFYGIRAVLPHMRAKRWGRIVNIASAHGLVASAQKSAYVAAKHGLVGLTKVTALETAGTGITCNAICPGWVLTPLVQKQIDAIAARDCLSGADAAAKLLTEKQPSKQFVAPDDIGGLVLFLCSAAAQQMTGSSLSIDGGWTAV